MNTALDSVTNHTITLLVMVVMVVTEGFQAYAESDELCSFWCFNTAHFFSLDHIYFPAGHRTEWTCTDRSTHNNSGTSRIHSCNTHWKHFPVVLASVSTDNIFSLRYCRQSRIITPRNPSLVQIWLPAATAWQFNTCVPGVCHSKHTWDRPNKCKLPSRKKKTCAYAHLWPFVLSNPIDK